MRALMQGSANQWIERAVWTKGQYVRTKLGATWVTCWGDQKNDNEDRLPAETDSLFGRLENKINKINGALYNV